MLWRLARVLSLVLMAALGSSILMYYAPGYFTDARELDAQHAEVARNDLQQMRKQQTSLGLFLFGELRQWSHGDLGTSRQLGVPVAALLRDRALCSGQLLVTSVLLGWSTALLLAVPLSTARNRLVEASIAAVTVSLLSIPIGGLAMVCLLTNHEKPALILALVIAVRDFRMLHRSLGVLWAEPYLLHARAQGFSTRRILRAHIMPVLGRELLSVGIMSLTLALSAMVPVEVTFDRPGLGQLAWSAAMNRDLPVLVAVTVLVAACVGVAGLSLERIRKTDTLECAQ